MIDWLRIWGRVGHFDDRRSETDPHLHSVRSSGNPHGRDLSTPNVRSARSTAPRTEDASHSVLQALGLGKMRRVGALFQLDPGLYCLEEPRFLILGSLCLLVRVAR